MRNSGAHAAVTSLLSHRCYCMARPSRTLHGAGAAEVCRHFLPAAFKKEWKSKAIDAARMLSIKALLFQKDTSGSLFSSSRRARAVTSRTRRVEACGVADTFPPGLRSHPQSPVRGTTVKSERLLGRYPFTDLDVAAVRPFFSTASPHTKGSSKTGASRNRRKIRTCGARVRKKHRWPAGKGRSFWKNFHLKV